MTSDADRWDSRYRDATPPELVAVHPLLPTAATHAVPGGKASDIACGWGDAGLWLSQRGFEVNCFDVSSVALESVQQRAVDRGVTISVEVHDTKTDGTPAGPWDLMWCAHYLDRDMLSEIGAHLAEQGIAAIAVATMTNLERHERPSARFLLEPNELLELALAEHSTLEVLHFDEAWRESGVHEAWLIVRRATNDPRRAIAG